MRRIWVATLASLLLGTCVHAALVAPTETGETGLATIPTTDILEPWHFSTSAAENGGIESSTPVSDVKIFRTQFTLGVGLLSNLELTAQCPTSSLNATWPEAVILTTSVACALDSNIVCSMRRPARR